ncbi:MAG: helix-turn-helix transcriptional regulator [Rhodobacterales bacterium]
MPETVKPETVTPETLLGVAIKTLQTAQFEAAFCAWVQACVPFDNITTLAYFQNQPPKCLMSQSIKAMAHKNIDTIYLAGAYLLDPFHELHITGAPRGLYRLSDIAPDRFQRNRYFLDYYRNTTMVDEIGFVGYPAKSVSIHVCLGRDSHSGQRFSNRVLATAARMVPVVTALAERHWSGLNSTGTYTEVDIVARLMAAVTQAHDVSLSPRQAEVAVLILRGHSSVSIGLRLGISTQTVKVFRKQLYRKCKISSQAELFNLMLPLLVA